MHGLVAVLIFAGLVPVIAAAQSSLTGNPERHASRPPAVTYLYPEQIRVPAGKPAKVSLHFRVAPGLHINSHTPSDEELIPTTLTIPESSGARLESAAYPAGTIFVLPLDKKTRLSVYTGEFIIEAQIVATAGSHLVEARLHFQACDDNVCMPPRTITAPIDVIGD